MDFNLTTGLAGYGALLSTIVFLWNLRRDLRDRARPIVTANRHVLMGRTHREQKIGIEVINKGRRPVTIVAAGFRLDTRSDENTATAFDDTLPEELTEGQKHITYVNPTEIEPRNILYAWVRDATGRTYYSQKRPIKP